MRENLHCPTKQGSSERSIGSLDPAADMDELFAPAPGALQYAGFGSLVRPICDLAMNKGLAVSS